MRIFLSYSHADRKLAEDLAAALRTEGHEVFFDQASLRPGESTHPGIARAIRRAKVFVFLASPDSIKDGSYARSELLIASRRWPNPTGHFLPVLIRGVTRGELPAPLTAVTAVDPNGNVEAEVCQAIRDLAAAGPSWPRAWIGALGVLVALAAVISGLLWLFVSLAGGPSDLSTGPAEVGYVPLSAVGALEPGNEVKPGVTVQIRATRTMLRPSCQSGSTGDVVESGTEATVVAIEEDCVKIELEKQRR